MDWQYSKQGKNYAEKKVLNSNVSGSIYLAFNLLILRNMCVVEANRRIFWHIEMISVTEWVE